MFSQCMGWVTHEQGLEPLCAKICTGMQSLHGSDTPDRDPQTLVISYREARGGAVHVPPVPSTGGRWTARKQCKLLFIEHAASGCSKLLKTPIDYSMTHLQINPWRVEFQVLHGYSDIHSVQDCSAERCTLTREQVLPWPRGHSGT